jgi:hypothetical protein
VAEDWEAEWMDEDVGWKRSTSEYRFHSTASRAKDPDPDPKDYAVDELYRRSIVSVIRERLSNPHENRLFHYEPFELFWSQPHCEDKRLYGELYTPSAFIDANREVQEMSGEPGCNLLRVVVALMFWSDVTHLTSFGNAKLWLAYLFFGNEYKHRRCKPTCHLCNHVAYFQMVNDLFLLPYFTLIP